MSTIASNNQDDHRYELYLKWCIFQKKRTTTKPLEMLVKSAPLKRWFYRLLETKSPLLAEELAGIVEEWEAEFIKDHWAQGLNYYYPKALLANINYHLN